MRIFIYLIFLSLPYCLFGQSIFNKLYPEEIKLSNGEEVKRITFSTQHNIENFYQALCRDFGQPEIKNLSWTCTGLNIIEFSNEEVSVKITLAFMNGRDMDWKKLTIAAETFDKKSLLKPKTRSYKRIKGYFEKKIKEAII